ncbi:MAG: hypothetical protein ACOC83_03685 [Gemmatimonadota bacterium]
MRHLLTVMVPTLVILALAACQDGDSAADGEDEASTSARPGVVEVSATDFEFDAPDRIPTVAVHVEEAPEGFMLHDVNLVRRDGDTTVDDVVAWMDWMDLEPGSYAWVSEGYGPRGMVEEFTVE